MQAERAVPVGVRIGTRENMREGYVAVALGCAALTFAIVPAVAVLCLLVALAGVALGARVRWRAERIPGRVGAGLGVAAIGVGALGATVAGAGLFGA